MVLLGIIELYEQSIKSDGKSDGIYVGSRQAGVTAMLILSHCKV